jgi:hypothetical protein
VSLSVRTRFEVFKRDRFTCSYCGRTPPEVLLEVDHIVPRAAGGSDDLPNLTTACASCNRGKAARLLEEGTAPVVGRATVEELAERVEQAKAYMELLGGLQSVIDQQVRMVIDAWARAFGGRAIEQEDGTYWQLDGYEPWPDERSVRRVLRSLTLADVLVAVDIAAAKMSGTASLSACRYFFGVCFQSIKQGRSPGESFRRDQDPEQDYELGIVDGQRLENRALRDLFLDHEGRGYATLDDVVAALWPRD